MRVKSLSLKTTHTVLQLTSELRSKQASTTTTGWTAHHFLLWFILLPLLTPIYLLLGRHGYCVWSMKINKQGRPCECYDGLIHSINKNTDTFSLQGVEKFSDTFIIYWLMCWLFLTKRYVNSGRHGLTSTFTPVLCLDTRYWGIFISISISCYFYSATTGTYCTFYSTAFIWQL